jgi:hypothetical protein
VAVSVHFLRMGASGLLRMDSSGLWRPVRRARGAWRRISRGDRLSLLVLVLVPVLLEVPLTLAGHPLLPGDDLTQNYPLRVLAGEVIRSGHLPGWDPFIWSGTPLLAGWNAGAMYPGTWLFAIMPGVAAWTINLVLVGATCGTGSYVLLRRLGCREIAALLGALVFTYTGFMSGQIVHIGLVQGTAWTPWMLVAVDGLASLRLRQQPKAPSSWWRRAAAEEHRTAGEEPGPGDEELWPVKVRQTDDASELGWVLLLAVASALVVLAGDPRAASTAAVIVGIYTLACWWRARGRARRFLRGMIASALLAAALSALQWAPGIAFLHASQRGVSAYAFFGGGSLALGQIGGLLVLPFALGSNANFGAPIYFGNYNLPEVTIGVGLTALVAAFALLPGWLATVVRAARKDGGARKRPSRPGRGLGVWYVTVVVGILLTLGTDTPLGHVLVHVPLYSGERLQNRNAAILDFALSVLLAFFLDDLLASASLGKRPRAEDSSGQNVGPLATTAGRLLALVPIAWLAALVACGFVAPVALEDMIGIAQARPDLPGLVGPYLLVTLGLGLGLAGVILAWHRIRPRVRELALVAFVVVDVAMYVSNAAYSGVATALLETSTPLSAELAAVTGPLGRFAIYNPSFFPTGNDPQASNGVGVTDLNLLRHIASVQGYGSIVEGAYQNATNTHAFEDLDQTRLSGATFDSFDLDTLLTLPGYFQVSLTSRSPIPVAGGKPVTVTGAPAQQPDTPTVPTVTTGPWTIAPGGSSSWLLASTYTIVRATVVLNTLNGARPARVVVGLEAPGGTLHDYTVAVSNGIAELKLPAVERAERIVVENPTSARAVVGAVVAVTRSPDDRLLLDGALQGSLPSPHWEYLGALAPFVVFGNTQARGAAWLERPGSTSPSGPIDPSGTITTGATLATGAETMYVVAPRPALLVRSENYAGGWTARITPTAGGRTRVEPVHEIGLVQAVKIPAGSYIITWRYAPTALLAGLLVSAAGAVVAIAVLLFWLRRRSGTEPDVSTRATLG